MNEVRKLYRFKCRNERCRAGSYQGRRKMTADDVVCRFCYKRLPEPLRQGLWLRDDDGPGVWEGRVNLALNWLDENPE
jgi:hypothetical protein